MKIAHKLHHGLKSSQVDTPLGLVAVVSNENALYLLKFIEDSHALDLEIEHFQERTKLTIEPGITKAFQFIKSELKAYFEGNLHIFKTPLCLIGSPFQKLSWESLRSIPYGETRSYAQQANVVGNSLAYRAVANANGANQIAIIIPCHRVINHSGKLGGYRGGLWRKKWLLEHEKQNMQAMKKDLRLKIA